MRRGDLATVALPGDLGKPRPALIIQSDLFNEILSVTVLPLTSTRVEAPLLRIDVPPTIKNGLQRHSQVMVDKTTTIKRQRIGQIIGRVNQHQLAAANRSLIVFLGIV